MVEPSADDPLLAAYLQRRTNIVRFLAPRAGSLAAAEDLAQELYLKLAVRDRAEAVGNPNALLYRMALNLLLDRARGDTRAAARDTAWREIARASVGGEDVADDPPADEAVSSAQRLRQLIDAVDGLAPQMGRAFRLHKLEGLSHAQTAQVMGLSVKAVEKHVSAALKALTRRLAP
ncbi:MAG TPA: sigma-70 family RNA polymerase sigma factor [Phenylobacterium sp.]|nr:sigma-70 family RNA polymerase sigma factor [Phenylobacterium sp.]